MLSNAIVVSVQLTKDTLKGNPADVASKMRDVAKDGTNTNDVEVKIVIICTIKSRKIKK